MNSKDILDRIKIIEDNEDFLVVYKPAGLATQSSAFSDMDLEHYIKNSDSETGYTAVINRLDQPVEGLVLFARSKDAAAKLSGQMNRHSLKKEYLAVVDGIPKEPVMELNDGIIKDARSNTSKIVPNGTEGARAARLRFRCLGSAEGKSLLLIRLHTGRHHQIRAQLANAGIPIVGDWKYNPLGTKAEFPALCSYALGLNDTRTKEERYYKSLPQNKAFDLFEDIINYERLHGVLK